MNNGTHLPASNEPGTLYRNPGGRRKRHAIDRLMNFVCCGSTALLALMVALVLYYVAAEGLASISWKFLVHLPRPVGVPGGGMGNGILGSIIMVLMGSALGISVGVPVGIYLAEYGNGNTGNSIRFLTEVMNGIPTIVSGVVVYWLVVVPMHTFSAYAGAIALAIIMLPLVSRATEVAVRQVPQSWREASIALGATPARTIWSVVTPGARTGIITGALLAVARIAGETAPLLFTSFGNDVQWPTHLGMATAGLPLQIFVYAMSPYSEWKSQAWAGAFVLVMGLLLLNVVVRAFAGRSAISMQG
ncbi:MAG TPA: phosphate ABC transporter permease PstA [Armatimonadota bacterium]|nr:phosphate ABC transporter permease PstA [Armatimonadota bacterium]